MDGGASARTAACSFAGAQAVLQPAAPQVDCVSSDFDPTFYSNGCSLGVTDEALSYAARCARCVEPAQPLTAGPEVHLLLLHCLTSAQQRLQRAGTQPAPPGNNLSQPTLSQGGRGAREALSIYRWPHRQNRALQDGPNSHHAPQPAPPRHGGGLGRCGPLLTHRTHAGAPSRHSLGGDPLAGFSQSARRCSHLLAPTLQCSALRGAPGGHQAPALLSAAHLDTTPLCALQAVAQQPVAVNFQATASFKNYQGGVYAPSGCGREVNHALVVVGYRTSQGAPVWLVKNSWGSG